MKRLSWLRESMSIDIYYAFLDRRLLTGNYHIVGGSIMQLEGLTAWIVTLLTCL